MIKTDSLGNFFTLKKVDCNNPIEFINYWRQLYTGDDSKYFQNINVSEFSEENIVNLFEWKNGMTLKGSGGKEKSLNENILKRISIINEHKKTSNFDLDKFNKDFEKLSAVWKIFLLHVIKPNIYPIYDQNIHRAYNCIFDLDWHSITNTISENQKLNFYFGTYLDFVKSTGVTDLKALDEAFFCLGQFLKTRKQGRLI